MNKDRKRLSGGDIDRLALRVEDGTATPDEVRELIAEFVRQGHDGRIEPRLIAHVAGCFRAFLAGEKILLATPERGRLVPMLVPITSLDKAFGLTSATRGRPPLDEKIHHAVAMEVLARMIGGDTLEEAAGAITDDRHGKGLPISSETEVRAAWAAHKLDALLLLRYSRLPEVDPHAPAWTPREVARLGEIFKDLGLAESFRSSPEYWGMVAPENSENKSA